MLKKYIVILGLVLIGLVIAYQISWIHSIKSYQEEKLAQEKNRNELQMASDDLNEHQKTDSIDSNMIQAAASANENLILQTTEIIIESYDEDGVLTQREITTPNAELIGKDRLDIMMYANDYKKHASKEELNQGLERMVVTNFSSDSVTLVKYYGAPIQEPGYWIAVRDGIIVVYTEDKSEIYEFTNIEMWQLPQELQIDLVDGIYVQNERELFDFLQTYSS